MVYVIGAEQPLTANLLWELQQKSQVDQESKPGDAQCSQKNESSPDGSKQYDVLLWNEQLHYDGK